MPEIALHWLAHGRAGDKGNRLNVSVIAYDPADYDLLRDQLTAKRVRATFADRQPSQTRRYELPRLAALNFVLDDVLEGGVNRSLNLDTHGKTLSFRVLAMTVDVPDGHPATRSQHGNTCV